MNTRTGCCLSLCMDYAFKSTKKLNCDSLGLLDKPKIPGHCGFPLANPYSGESVYCVPISNPDNTLILLCICFANLKFVRHLTVSNQCQINLANMASAMAAIISSVGDQLNLLK